MDEIKPNLNSDDVSVATDQNIASPKAVPAPSGRTPIRRSVRRPTPIRASTLSLWLALPLVFLVGLGSGWLLWGQNTISNPGNTQVKVNEEVKRFNVVTDNDPTQGPENAKVTIIEFSDYQCPYCISWYQDVYTRLMADYEGKIRFVYRDFPLYSIHPEAGSAAEAANCAGAQDAYWQYHDALFGQKNGLGETAYSQYASDLGLNVEEFNKCVSEHRYKSEVDADYKYASSLGVSSTPTFFVNGLAVVGAQPYEVFQQIIDKELAGEIPK